MASRNHGSKRRKEKRKEKKRKNLFGANVTHRIRSEGANVYCMLAVVELLVLATRIDLALPLSASAQTI